MTATAQETYEVSDELPVTGTSVMVRSPAASIEEARAAMALRDDDQILAACHGALIKEWMYSFAIGGKQVDGISVTGAAEIARIRAEAGFPIRFPVVFPNEVRRNDRLGLEVQVTARDVRTGAESIALVFEPYFDEKGRPNTFVERKALSKAKRNAILDLVPEQQCLQLLKAAKDSASGKVGRKPQVRQVADGAKAVPVNSGYGGDAQDASAEDLAHLAKLVEHPGMKAHRAAIERRVKESPTSNTVKTAIAFCQATIDHNGQ